MMTCCVVSKHASVASVERRTSVECRPAALNAASERPEASSRTIWHRLTTSSHTYVGEVECARERGRRDPQRRLTSQGSL